jgi:bifunctional oligoribonuclease and PAP phosphatase NrnA
MQSLSEITSILGRVRRVLIIAHIVPDGDTLGSALGLSWALRKRGIETHLACADPVPSDLRFIPGWEDFTPRRKVDEEAILVIDASDLERVGNIYAADAFASVPVINIDHHTTNLHFGNVNMVAPTAATAELILQLITYLDIPLDATIATCLLTGMVTDTHCFRTSSITAEAMHAVARLMDAGASLPNIADAVFNHRPMALLKLWGPTFTNAGYADGILWTDITQDLLRTSGADVSSSKGLVNFLATLDEARVAITFRELEDHKIEVSMRSRPGLDVDTIALALGGGGHPRASGCILSASLAEAHVRVIGAIREAMGLIYAPA